MTREKNIRKCGEDVTFGGHLGNIRRRCHNKQLGKWREGRSVRDREGGASVPGPGAGGPFGRDSEGELEGQLGKQRNCEKGTE